MHVLCNKVYVLRFFGETELVGLIKEFESRRLNFHGLNTGISLGTFLDQLNTEHIEQTKKIEAKIFIQFLPEVVIGFVVIVA